MRQIRIRTLKTLEEMVWEKESEIYKSEIASKYNKTLVSSYTCY